MQYILNFVKMTIVSSISGVMFYRSSAYYPVPVVFNDPQLPYKRANEATAEQPQNKQTWHKQEEVS